MFFANIFKILTLKIQIIDVSAYIRLSLIYNKNNIKIVRSHKIKRVEINKRSMILNHIRLKK